MVPPSARFAWTFGGLPATPAWRLYRNAVRGKRGDEGEREKNIFRA